MTGDTPDPAHAETEVDAVLEEFGGDPRAAIRALLHDLAVLPRTTRASVSRGYVRGQNRHSPQPADWTAPNPILSELAQPYSVLRSAIFLIASPRVSSGYPRP